MFTCGSVSGCVTACALIYSCLDCILSHSHVNDDTKGPRASTCRKGSSRNSFLEAGQTADPSSSVSLVQEEWHSAQCRKSSHSKSSVSDSCRVLSESWVRRLEQRELQLVPDLGISWTHTHCVIEAIKMIINLFLICDL